MTASIITGKTFEEMISEATALDLSARFKDSIREHYNDVHAMGMVIHVYEEGNAKVLFKDAEFTKPVTDYELLAMYLDEAVPTVLTENNTVLERYRDLESASLKYLEYKNDNITKRFYQIGNFYSGETYSDLIGFVPGKAPESDTAVVGTAIVGKAKVSSEDSGGGDDLVIVPEMTFTTNQQEGSAYGYVMDSVHIDDYDALPDKVNVKFDGTLYSNVQRIVNERESGETPSVNMTYGDFDPENTETTLFANLPFALTFVAVGDPASAEYQQQSAILTQTEGEHTIEVRG